MLEKTKKVIIYCLLGKNYIAKNEHSPFYGTFFRYERATDVNNVIKKIKIQYILKKLLVKAIIVFTSFYFESYRKIPARSNKSIR